MNNPKVKDPHFCSTCIYYHHIKNLCEFNESDCQRLIFFEKKRNSHLKGLSPGSITTPLCKNKNIIKTFKKLLHKNGLEYFES